MKTPERSDLRPTIEDLLDDIPGRAIVNSRQPIRKIFTQISKVMEDIQPISKARSNTAQGYKFRGIDDVYNMIQPILAKHKVFMMPQVVEETTTERASKSGSALFHVRMKVLYCFYAEDGSSVSATVSAEGMDSGDKAINKALSAAQKYALLQIFCIPTDEEKDSEHESHEVVHSDEISDAQRKRLYAISKTRNWSEESVKALLNKYGYQTSKEILKKDYEAICKTIESEK